MEVFTMPKLQMTTTTNVKKCDGAYVGTMKELPIVVQADNMDELKREIVSTFALYVEHHQDELAKNMLVKATV